MEAKDEKRRKKEARRAVHQRLRTYFAKWQQELALDAEEVFRQAMAQHATRQRSAG